MWKEAEKIVRHLGIPAVIVVNILKSKFTITKKEV